MRASRVPLCILYFLAIRVIISRSWSGTCPPYFDRQFFRGKKRRMIDSPGVLVGRECRGAVSRRRWHAAQHIIALSCGKIGTGRYAAVNPLFFSRWTSLFCVQRLRNALVLAEKFNIDKVDLLHHGYITTRWRLNKSLAALLAVAEKNCCNPQRVSSNSPRQSRRGRLQFFSVTRAKDFCRKLKGKRFLFVRISRIIH